MKTTFLFAMLTLTFMGIFYACTKSSDANADETVLKIRMTDNPFNADEVNIDIREIRVNTSDSTEWTVLPTTAGVYNLLALQNGIDTLVASGTIPGSYVGEVRFILGTDNSIKIGNDIYPLTIPGGSESGLKLKADRKLNRGLDSLTVDFDAAMSVNKAGNGKYMLRPVLKLK
jgi:hypothetical protein